MVSAYSNLWLELERFSYGESLRNKFCVLSITDRHVQHGFNAGVFRGESLRIGFC